MSEEKKIEKPNANKLLLKTISFNPKSLEHYDDALKECRELIHFYTEKFSNDLPQDVQLELSKLFSRADILTLELNILTFQIEKLHSQADLAISLKKPFSVDKKTADELSANFEEIGVRIIDLNKSVLGFLKKIAHN